MNQKMYLTKQYQKENNSQQNNNQKHKKYKNLAKEWKAQNHIAKPNRIHA